MAAGKAADSGAEDQVASAPDTVVDPTLSAAEATAPDTSAAPAGQAPLDAGAAQAAAEGSALGRLSPEERAQLKAEILAEIRSTDPISSDVATVRRQQAAAALPAQPPDETVPGGAYKVRGEWVNAEGQVVPPPPNAE